LSTAHLFWAAGVALARQQTERLPGALRRRTKDPQWWEVGEQPFGDHLEQQLGSGKPGESM
jgi:hypothetical protein